MYQIRGDTRNQGGARQKLNPALILKITRKIKEFK